MPDLWMDVDAALSEVPVNVMPLLDDTDFKTRETAIAYNAAGMDLVWNFVTTAGAYTQTAVTPTTGGNYDWANQGDAMYSIEIPASGGASINNDTEGFGWFTGYVTGVLPWRGPIIGFRAAGLNNALIDDAYSATRGLAGTALPAAAADAAGGLAISDAGGLDLDAKLANTNEVTAARMATLTDWINGGRLDLLLDAIKAVTDTLPADSSGVTTLLTRLSALRAGYLDELAAANIPADVDTLLARIIGTIATGSHVAQTGDAYLRLGAPVGASISADIAAVLAKVVRGVPKNIALANFPFMMTNSTTHAPEAGATVTCTRSIDGGAFGAGALSGLTEVASGAYVIDFAAGDLNGKTVILRCTATGCDDTIVTIITED